MNETKSKNRILTGDRPTGPLHLGHYVGSLANRVKLQDEYDCFFIIADYQVLTDHIKDTAKVEQNIMEIALDYLSVGIDPEKCSIFIQSRIPEIAELATYFSMLVSIPRLQRNPTVKDEMDAAKISKKEMSYGFLGYPISQAADILIVRADLVPVGDDQLPHVEQTRDVARTFNRTFNKVLPLPEALVSNFSRLPGTDQQKMSKSRNNAIFLSDPPEIVEKKVMKAYTDPTRLKATDPGHLEGNVVFAYLDAYATDKDELKDLKDRYQKGQVGDVEIKKRLTQILNEFLNPIRERRGELQSNPDYIKKVLVEGTERTREESKKTIQIVREAMNYDYMNLVGDL